MSATLIAARRRELDDAIAAQAEAVRAVDEVATRIAALEAERSAITKRRLDGSAGPTDAAEYAALAGDLEVLHSVLVERKARAAALDPGAARHALSLAENEHAREQAGAEFHALASRLAELDHALVGVLRQVVAAGARIGLTQGSQLYRPSQPLDRFLRYGAKP